MVAATWPPSAESNSTTTPSTAGVADFCSAYAFKNISFANDFFWLALVNGSPADGAAQTTRTFFPAKGSHLPPNRLVSSFSTLNGDEVAPGEAVVVAAVAGSPAFTFPPPP